MSWKKIYLGQNLPTLQLCYHGVSIRRFPMKNSARRKDWKSNSNMLIEFQPRATYFTGWRNFGQNFSCNCLWIRSAYFHWQET